MLIQLDGIDAVQIRFTIPWITPAMEAHIERLVLDELRLSTAGDHPPLNNDWLILLDHEENGLQARIHYSYGLMSSTDQHRITSLVLDELARFRDRHTLHFMAG